MKANYLPQNIERISPVALLFLSTIQSAKKLMKSKILVLPFLLLSVAGSAQQLTAMLNTGHAGVDVNASLNNDSATDDEASSNTLLASKKGDTYLNAEKNLKKTPAFIPNNEGKAKSMVEYYFKGIDDADSNYRTRKSCKRGIFFATLIGGPAAGLIPTIACSATPPNNSNLNIPSSTLVTNDSYMKGYKSEAHYIKKHNTWPIYILTSIIWIAAANMILR